MSITREQLKVGETYIGDSSAINRRVLAIGERKVFFCIADKDRHIEDSWLLEDFLTHNSIIKPEPKKLGEVAWFMDKNDGEIMYTKIKGDCFNSFSKNRSYQRVIIKDNEIWEFYE